MNNEEKHLYLEGILFVQNQSISNYFSLPVSRVNFCEVTISMRKFCKFAVIKKAFMLVLFETILIVDMN